MFSRDQTRIRTGLALLLGLVSALAGGCFRDASAQAGVPVQGAPAAGPRPAQGVGDRIRERLRQRLRPTRTAGAIEIEAAGVHATSWRPASAPTTRAPVVIFSHGFHGSSTQSKFLMTALAEHGYVVIAPDHRDSLKAATSDHAPLRPTVPFENPSAWTDRTYRDRADDITSMVKALKKDPAWAASCDWSRIALVGHSLGGYTVLGLAGAWPAWKLGGVKAVVALSPYCSPFLPAGGLRALTVPVMYQGGTSDFGITPAVKRKGGAYDLTPAPAVFVEFDRAGHFAWTDLNPTYQEEIIRYSVAFLDKYVKGDAAADPSKRLDQVADLRSK